MDSVLDEALDELDDDCNGGTRKSNQKRLDSKTGHDSPSHAKSIDEDIHEATANNCNKDINDQTERDVDAEGNEQYQLQTAEEALGRLLEEMNRTSIEDLGQEEDFLKEMFGLSVGGSENFNADAVIDGMVEQLVSKEMMYEPMKQVLDKFPSYLDENKGNLSAEEYRQRCEQHDSFKRLITVYEEEPSNTAKLMDLMQEVQKYGQPPMEIVREIAPDLDLDDEGVPAINSLMHIGSDDEECCIM